MKQKTWRKHHKWLGIILAFFLLMFCVSGIILNHRRMVSGINVSRSWLPDDYAFYRWNGGLLRGTLPYTDAGSINKVIVYGNSGLWTTDSLGTRFDDFNAGLPHCADQRNIKGCVATADNNLWAASQFGLFRYDNSKGMWQEVKLPADDEEKISDITVHGDTLVVVGRSEMFVSHAPFKEFKSVKLCAPAGYDGNVSLFKTVWDAHNGSIFGIGGRLIIDCVAIVFMIICITGIVYWLMPKYIRRLKKKGKDVKRAASLLKSNLNWHDKAGRYTFGILLFVAVTGWCLRPPLLIAISKIEVPAIPFSSVSTGNAWHDKLRMIRYDADCNDWLLSTSEGFYSLSSLSSVPQPISAAPPVSVMGINAWNRDAQDNWLVGSFSGMYSWNRKDSVVKDYFTGETVHEVSGAPFGKFAVSGFSDDFKCGPAVVEYIGGTDKINMPSDFTYLPMSLWNVAHEIHSGRIYTFLGSVNILYITIAGIFIIWCLVSGYKIRMKKKKK